MRCCERARRRVGETLALAQRLPNATVGGAAGEEGELGAEARDMLWLLAACASGLPGRSTEGTLPSCALSEAALLLPAAIMLLALLAAALAHPAGCCSCSPAAAVGLPALP